LSAELDKKQGKERKEAKRIKEEGIQDYLIILALSWALVF